MTKLKKIITMGFLKNGEEIYLCYRGEIYSGRIFENGEIKTKLGSYKSLSKAASDLMKSNPNCMRKVSTKNGETPNNGGYWWRTWNNIQLTDLFKKYLK